MKKCPICGDIPIDSHVVPYSFNFEPLKIYPLKIGYSKRSPIGIYDKILFSKCDGHLGKVDDYAKSVLKKGALESLEDGINANGIYVKKLTYNYHLLARFLLSVIYRSQYCSHVFYSKCKNDLMHQSLCELFEYGNIEILDEFSITLNYFSDFYTNGYMSQPIFSDEDRSFEMCINNMVLIVSHEHTKFPFPHSINKRGITMIVPIKFEGSKYQDWIHEMILHSQKI
jgi:hypothetical protein